MTDTHVNAMHCTIKGQGLVKATVTMPAVCLTTYAEVSLFTFGEGDISKGFQRLSRYAQDTPVSRADFEADFNDLLIACSKVQRTEMTLVSGDKIISYCIGEPIADEKGFLELSPQRKEWWDHPSVQPLVAAIQTYFKDFSPWLLQKDQYIGMLSAKSTLI